MFTEYTNSEELSDLVVRIGVEKFYAHKLLLAMSSPFFKAQFYSGHWSSRDADGCYVAPAKVINTILKRPAPIKQKPKYTKIDNLELDPYHCLSSNLLGRKRLRDTSSSSEESH